MSSKYTEISIEQLARLARDAGVSVKDELPEPVIKAMKYGRRSTDIGGSSSTVSRPLNAVNQLLGGFRF